MNMQVNIKRSPSLLKKINILKLVERAEGGVRQAFMDAVNNMTSDVQIDLLTDAIRSMDVEAALRIMGFDKNYFRPMQQALDTAAFAEGDAFYNAAKKEARKFGAVITGTFDSIDPRLQSTVLTDTGHEITTKISDKLRKEIQEVLLERLNTGFSAERTALDLVGRIGPSGYREGGLLGLSKPQEKYVRNMRESLATGDWSGYKAKTLRDKRFDKTVRGAFDRKEPLSEDQIDRVAGKYSNKLLKKRGKDIARTELMSSIHGVQEQGLQSMVDSGEIDRENIVTEWVPHADEATRKSHRDARDQKRTLGEPFDIGGHALLYPGDPSGPPEEIINCRCYRRIDIDFIKQAYDGQTPDEREETRRSMGIRPRP